MLHACEETKPKTRPYRCDIGATIAENEVRSHQSRKRANKKRKKKAVEEQAAEDSGSHEPPAEDSGSDEPPPKGLKVYPQP